MKKHRPFNHEDVTARIPELNEESFGLPVTPRFSIPPVFERPRELVRHSAAQHPRKLELRAPAAPRAVAMALERKGHSICGLSALAVFGLNYFADGCETTLYATVEKKALATGPFYPTVMRSPGRAVWTVFYRGQPLLISQPADAVIEALLHIRAGIHRWRVDPGLEPDFVRAVQLVDSCRRYLGISTTEIVQAGRHRISRKWLERVVAASSELADSPKETEMRLRLQEVCDEHGLTLAEQFPLIADGKIVTVFDFAIVELKIGLMYDGGHHFEREQRDKDSRINIESAILDWAVARFTSGTIAGVAGALERLVYRRAARFGREDIAEVA